MKKIITALLTAIILTSAAEEKVYTRQWNDKALVRTARTWMKRGEWRNGFNKADPDKTVNAADFYTQYKKNREQWDAAFRWLQETDLLAIDKGKHAIAGGTLTASVEDAANYPLGQMKSESHREHIDLQYCVSGVEGFALLEHTGSRPSGKYKPDVIHYDYDAGDLRFRDSRPDRFFLFFPDDWHIAKVKTKKATDKIRVVIIKIDYAP